MAAFTPSASPTCPRRQLPEPRGGAARGEWCTNPPLRVREQGEWCTNGRRSGNAGALSEDQGLRTSCERGVPIGEAFGFTEGVAQQSANLENPWVAAISARQQGVWDHQFPGRSGDQGAELAGGHPDLLRPSAEDILNQAEGDPLAVSFRGHGGAAMGQVAAQLIEDTVCPELLPDSLHRARSQAVQAPQPALGDLQLLVAALDLPAFAVEAGQFLGGCEVGVEQVGGESVDGARAGDRVLDDADCDGVGLAAPTRSTRAR